MADGNWRVGIFMDAAASQEQAEKLGAVFAGQLGGPMAMLAPLISEMLGVEVAPIEYVHPANSTLTIARATVSRVNAFGLAFDNTGKNGHSAPFSWAA